MIRRLLVIASLLLCGGSIVLWVRSIRVFDQISFLTHADTRYALATYPHGLDLEVETHFRSHPPTWNPISSTPPKEGWKFSWHYYSDVYGNGISDAPPFYQWSPPAHYFFAGIGYDTTTDNWTYPGGTQIFKRTTHLDIPFWLMVLALTIPGILVLARIARRRKRTRAGLCVFCGYDLRGSPDRCPECGRTVSQDVVSSAHSV